MTTLEFQDFRFEEQEDKIRVNFLKLFFFEIEKVELKKIANFKIDDSKIIFNDISEEKARKAFTRLINRKFPDLKNKITKNQALYLHKNSGIPLIGSLSFGIIDKGTDMLELKPITSCNIDCIFCSVDEGLSTKKTLDIVIEKDYLIQETKKLLEFKKQPVHVYINPHGEPLLYADIVDLIKDLKKLKQVKAVSIITNATLLTENLAEQLIKAGLDELNVSLNALNPEKTRELAGTNAYNIEKIKKILEMIKNRIKIIVAPVFLDKINNKDIEDLTEYCKENNFEILIQNFLRNKRGRKPTKELEFSQFYDYLKKLEKKYNISLIKQGEITKTKELPKPFRKGDIIEAEILSKGRYDDESLATAKDRIITIKCQFTKKKKAKIKLTKDRYNIFYGTTI